MIEYLILDGSQFIIEEVNLSEVSLTKLITMQMNTIIAMNSFNNVIEELKDLVPIIKELLTQQKEAIEQEVEKRN